MKTIILLICLLFANNSYPQQSGTLRDNRDNQVYKWVRIGNQVWMAENLDFNSGQGSGKFGNNFGRVYDWKTAKKVCPYGWHLPSDNEWQILEMQLGMSSKEASMFGGAYERKTGLVGYKLKSTSGWEMYMGKSNGEDKYGFSALPGGYYQTNIGKFQWYGVTITLWTSTSADTKNAIERTIRSSDDGVGRSNSFYKVHGAYVRCIKD